MIKFQMQKIEAKGGLQIFEKIVRQNGVSFLVRFVVVERGGGLRGKVISCEPITVLNGTSSSRGKYCLPTSFSTQTLVTEKTPFQRIVSPFSKLEFLTSIQIRAPAHSR